MGCKGTRGDWGTRCSRTCRGRSGCRCRREGRGSSRDTLEVFVDGTWGSTVRRISGIVEVVEVVEGVKDKGVGPGRIVGGGRGGRVLQVLRGNKCMYRLEDPNYPYYAHV